MGQQPLAPSQTPKFRPYTSPVDTAGPHSQTHAELLAGVAAGSSVALRELYEALGPMVMALATQMLQSREDAEEVLQDTFVALHRKAASYNPELASVKTFTYAVARSLCLERLRSRRSRPVKDDGVGVHDPTQNVVVASAPSVAVERVYVQQALAKLDPVDRALLEANFFQDLTHAEISAVRNMPLGTIKSRLRRALLGLREMLEDA